MDTIVGNYYVVDNKLFNSDEINFKFSSSDYKLYEVIRTSRGVLLFSDDHIERLYLALKVLKLNNYFYKNEILAILQLLIKENLNREGNVKLLCRFHNQRLQYAAFYIPHLYPSEKLYKEGVKLIPYSIERQDPGIKQIHVNELIKEQIGQKLSAGGAYEILLVNMDGYITEGSKSNFFLVKGKTLYSAPDKWILKGITRKYVLQIAEKLGFACNYAGISLNSISSYDSAFICGTSPKVLSVKEIDGIKFDVTNPVLLAIRKAYNDILSNYLEQRL